MEVTGNGGDYLAYEEQNQPIVRTLAFSREPQFVREPKPADLARSQQRQSKRWRGFQRGLRFAQ